MLLVQNNGKINNVKETASKEIKGLRGEVKIKEKKIKEEEEEEEEEEGRPEQKGEADNMFKINE